MKKLAIITLVINNYGTKLQSYALCKTIESFKIVEPEVISFTDSWLGSSVKTNRRKQFIDILKKYSFKSFKRLYDFIRYRNEHRVLRKTKHLYEDVVQKLDELYLLFDKEIPYSKTVYSIDDIRAGKLSNYDIFLVGSDQVWNAPRVGCLDVYMCDFLHGRKKALSYAASFAIDSIPEDLIDDYTKYIQNIDTLLVREKKGIELCKQLGRNDAKLVVDPTLLLEEKDYGKFLSNPEVMVGKGDYILVYSLKSSMKIFEEASKLASQYDCKMVILKRGIHPPFASSFINAQELIEVGPAEFMTLVKNAKCVVTSSYHALMFSLIFHTKFYLYLDNASAENSRLISSLTMFNLENQLYYETSSLPKQLPNIDFEAVDEIIKNIREYSIKLLRESIERIVS